MTQCSLIPRHIDNRWNGNPSRVRDAPTLLPLHAPT